MSAKLKEKAIQYGFAVMTDSELLESIKFKGTIEEYYNSYIYKACKELNNRYKRPDELYIKSSKNAYDLFSHLNDNDEEMFFCAFMKNNGRVITSRFIGKGNDSGVVVDIKSIVRLALENNASAAIISHNHPSGSIIPSKEDINLTLKIKNALELFDIKLLDHIIVAKNNGYYSFADEQII